VDSLPATNLPEPPAASSESEHHDPAKSSGVASRFPLPAASPTQTGPNGIRFDFNQGCRLQLPDDRDYTATLRDLNTGNILYQTTSRGAFVQSTKKYYVRFGIEVRTSSGDVVFSHQQELRHREVLVVLPVGTLGDPIAWFPYVVKFQKAHQCRLTCAMAPYIIPLFRDAYPHIAFVSYDEVDVSRFYASYYIGLFFDDADHHWQPTDFRLVGLHRTAGYILGVDPSEQKPLLALPDESRPIDEPYVCIAVQASTHAKKWNNPHGWPDVIRFLKERGYRIICIDREPRHGTGLVWTHIPHGVEDETGLRPLVERARWLRHASAFIGVSSGLAWLAWAAGCPVVMISGFTHPSNEFETPGRVINWHACNSCWNDVRHRFNHADYLWCPRHQGTERQFECTRLITPDHVKHVLATLLDARQNADPTEPATGTAQAAAAEHAHNQQYEAVE
jgi:autotransporter strand-loop-strand O-heptosyltransferase